MHFRNLLKYLNIVNIDIFISVVILPLYIYITGTIVPTLAQLNKSRPLLLRISHQPADSL